MNGFAGLRIAVVGPLPPRAGSSAAAGGMANQTRQLAELLAAERAAVEVVPTNAAYRPAWAARLPFVRALVRLVPYLAALWRVAGHSEVFHVMANSGWAWHLFAAPAIWIGWLRRVPVVVNYRGGEAVDFLAQAPWRVRWTMRRAARLVVPSVFLQSIFERHGMPADVLPNVIDLTRFRPRADGASGAEGTAPGEGGDGVGRGAHVIVTRNLEPIYDIATVLRAFALVYRQRGDARLTVAGSGPEAARLHALAAELAIAPVVRFTGALGRDAMAELYRDADACVNASLVDNTPNALLEALASGVPVVSTSVGGVPYLVEHEKTALLVAPQDSAALAGALLRVLGDAPLRARLVQAGLQQVQRHTWQQVAPELAALYRSVLVAAPAAAARV